MSGTGTGFYGRDVAHVHEIQTRVHVGREPAVDEVHDHLSRRGRLDVELTHGSRRIHDDEVETAPGPGLGDALGVELALLVAAHDLGARDGSLLVGGAAVGPEAERADRARVDDFRNPRLRGRPEQIVGPGDIGARELARIARPEPIVRGAVIERLDPGDGPLERTRVEKVPFDDFRREPFEIRAPAAGTDEAANDSAAIEQGPDDVRTDETGAAGDEIHVSNSRILGRRSLPEAAGAGPAVAPDGYAARFQAIIRTMSPGFFGSSRTTEASNPECIAQFLQSGSWRDSQYSQSVPFQNWSKLSDQVFPIR